MGFTYAVCGRCAVEYNENNKTAGYLIFFLRPVPYRTIFLSLIQDTHL